MAQVEELIGKTLSHIGTIADNIIFITEDCIQYVMYHQQDCCENVYIEDICGDLNDLIGEPILLAEKVTSFEDPEGVEPEYQESFTWTFYKFATRKGYVTIRWYGSSNGYYSESVSFINTQQDN